MQNSLSLSRLNLFKIWSLFVFKTSTYFLNINKQALAGVFSFKAETTKLKLNQAKNTSVLLTSSPIKIWGKSVNVLVSFNRTYKQAYTQT